MQFSQDWRKLALTAHIASSVGWLGAVIVFLGLALVGVRGEDDQLVRSVYIAMEALGWLVIMPFSVAALLSGLIQSAGTKWGFVRYYWVLSKLLITVGAGLLLLLHMQVMSTVAHAASAGTLATNHLRDPRMQLLGDAGAASVVLLIAVALSVFKPRGRTAFGRSPLDSPDEARTPMFYAFWATLGALLVAIVVRHLVHGTR